MVDLNGSGKRINESWIDTFVSHTDNLESPMIYRKWAGIATVGAVLEQKVCLNTSGPLYPNIYIFLVGHPGIGKTRTINAAAAFLRKIEDFHISPTSMTAASMVDALLESKRSIIRMGQANIEYNSMTIIADELSAFMHKFDDEMIGNLTTFYDVVVPYRHTRRGKDIKIKIQCPQLSILSGTTPSNLLKFMPENAWDQGFTSRVIMIYSDEKIVSEDIFAYVTKGIPDGMVHDLKIINALTGEYKVTVEYKNAINNWRKLGQLPVPTHPKLTHYNTRRLAHLFKLSMICAADRSNTLLLTKEDFNRAMGWLLEAEQVMSMIFEAGSVNVDSKAMEELVHYCMIMDKGKGIPDTMLVRRATELVPAMLVGNLLSMMERSGMIKVIGIDKYGLKYYKADR